MKQYTKTIRVQAVQWTGENLEEVRALLKDDTAWVHPVSGEVVSRRHGHAPVGNWVVARRIGNWFINAWHETDEDFTRDYKEVSECPC